MFSESSSTPSYYIEVQYLDSDGIPQTGTWRDTASLERIRQRRAALSRVIRAWFAAQGAEVLSVQLVIEEGHATRELAESDFSRLPAASGDSLR